MGEKSEHIQPRRNQFLDRITRFVKKEDLTLRFELTPNAKRVLGTLVARPNPTLAEFSFLGLGINGVVEEIVVADTSKYSDKSRLLFSGEYKSTSDKTELEIIFNKVHQDGRIGELLLLGHMHPTGSAIIDGIKYNISPSDTLLEPSGGGSGKGGPTSGGDLAFYKEFIRLNPNCSPMVAIAANTQKGPQLKVYDMAKLVKVKRYHDIDKVPQQTIDLK
jgi:hypothetical protein